MNNELIERARELAQAATPGPWMITVPEIEIGYTHGAVIWGEAVADEKPGWIKDGINIGEMAPSDNDDYPITHANHSNGLFVAASRELVPQLCDALEAAQAENARLREALVRFAKIDLTGPIGNEIAWDILNARAALEPRP